MVINNIQACFFGPVPTHLWLFLLIITDWGEGAGKKEKGDEKQLALWTE